MINLSGKYAIVTGAAKGIGAAIVKKFLEVVVENILPIKLSFNTILCISIACEKIQGVNINKVKVITILVTNLLKPLVLSTNSSGFTI